MPRLITLFAVLICALPSLHAAERGPVEPDPERVSAHAEALLAIPDRSLGSEGTIAAVDYLEAQLHEAGIDETWRQRTTVVVPVDEGSALRVDEDQFVLHPHVANGGALANTPPEGITAPLLFLGAGAADEVRGRPIEGAIVVLDGDSGTAWMRAAALGARAAIFRYPERIDAMQIRDQYLDASVDFPRFVVSDLPESLDGREATLTGAVRMASRQAQTLVARITGKGDADPAILAAGYESSGVIDGHAPGATRAWNAALLLELGRQLQEHPPRRDVILVFHGARADSFMGLRQLLGTIFDPIDRAAYAEDLGWDDAPMADAEAARLVYQLWRADLIKRDFQAFLDLAQQRRRLEERVGLVTTAEAAIDEDELERLLKEIDYVPEDRNMFAGLDYPPTTNNGDSDIVSDTAKQESGGGSDAVRITRWAFAIVLALAWLLLLTLHFTRGSPGWGMICSLLLLLYFVDKALLDFAEEKTETDIETEQEKVHEKGLQFVSEEAARRADDLQPILEDLRRVSSLGKKALGYLSRSDDPEHEAVYAEFEQARGAIEKIMDRRELDQDDSSGDNETSPSSATSAGSAAEQGTKETRTQLLREQREVVDRVSETAITLLNRRDRIDLEQARESYRHSTGETLRFALVQEKTGFYERHHRRWRDIQQKLGKRTLKRDDELPHLVDLIKAVLLSTDGHRSNLDRHVDVLRDQLDDLLSSIAIRKALNEGHDADDPFNPRLLVALDFTDGNRAYSSISHGHLVKWQDKLKALNQDLKHASNRLNEEELNGRLRYDPVPHELSDDPLTWWPDGYLHAGEYANLFLNAVTLSTINDARLKLGTPQDSAETFRDEVFLAQTHGLTRFLFEYLHGGTTEEPRAKDVELQVPVIRAQTRSEGSATGRKGFPYPYVRIQNDLHPTNKTSGWHRDVRPIRSAWGNAFGEMRVLWTPNKLPEQGNASFPVDLFGYDHNGHITQVVASLGQRKVAGIDNSGLKVGKGLRDLLMQVFNCQSSTLYGAFDPRLLRSLSQLNVLSATRDAPPNYGHFEVDRGIAAIFAPHGTNLRILGMQGKVDRRMLLLGDHMEDDEFAGLPPGGLLTSEPIADSSKRRPVPTALAVARDTFEISKARLDKLQRNGINPESTWSLLSDGQRRLEEAESAFDDGEIDQSEGYASAACSYLIRAYPNVLSTANDVVYGLVLMLLLAIPFAVVCERLFCSSKTIVGKVLGFAAFFGATFIFFLLFHPAFKLATTPVIIFLAFTIIVISGFVISIIYSRFEYEMELIRMSGLGMHKADVTRLGTILATGQLGISNMRRRPLRTFLTGITVVLMTFILLTFASFNDSAGTRSVALDATPSFEGVMMRRPGWYSFEDGSLERVKKTWGEQFRAYERRWVMSEDPRTKIAINGERDPEDVGGRGASVITSSFIEERNRTGAAPLWWCARHRPRCRLALPARGGARATRTGCRRRDPVPRHERATRPHRRQCATGRQTPRRRPLHTAFARRPERGAAGGTAASARAAGTGWR